MSAAPPLSPQAAARALARVRASCEVCGECWVWRGYTDQGTPRMSFQSKCVGVRKVVMLALGRKFKPGATFRAGAECDPLCVRPEHIRALPRVTHMRAIAKLPDTANAVRAAKIAATRRQHAKLTDAQVAYVLASPLSGRAVARELGADPSYVNRIRAGKARKNYSAAAHPFSQLLTTSAP